jgi:cyclopropane-fatty-acyl-phospholipid synthase
MTAHTVLERDALRRSAAEQREFERREVAAHYEHDPDIFSLVLDSQLTYSTGIFLNAEEDLETAQTRKFAHVRELLRLKPGDAVFDAGCGWGSILLNLAQHTGAQVHGITLSAKQREVALKRARERGIADRVRIDVTHIGEVGLAPESVDAIVFSGSIVHMHDRAGPRAASSPAAVSSFPTATFPPRRAARAKARRPSTSSAVPWVIAGCSPSPTSSR